MTAAAVRVLLLEQIHPEAAELLTSAGFLVETLDRALDEDELIERIGNVELIGIRSKTEVTARVLRGRDLTCRQSEPSASAPTRLPSAAAAERGVVGVQRAVLQHAQRWSSWWSPRSSPWRVG